MSAAEGVGNPEVQQRREKQHSSGRLPFPKEWTRVWQFPERKPLPPELRQGKKGTKVAWEEEGEGARHVR